MLVVALNLKTNQKVPDNGLQASDALFVHVIPEHIQKYFIDISTGSWKSTGQIKYHVQQFLFSID